MPEVGPGALVLSSCPVRPAWTRAWTPSGFLMVPPPGGHLNPWTACPSASTEAEGRGSGSCLHSGGSPCIEQELVKILESALSVTASADLGTESS